MKKKTIFSRKAILRCCLALLVVSCVSNAWAAPHSRGRSAVRFGVLVVPVWRPWTYPSAYFNPSYSSSMIDSSQLVYIEQDVPPPAQGDPAAQVNYWYYCAESKAYYPYVNECPGGWQKVLPQVQNPP